MATIFSGALGIWRLGSQRVQLDGQSGALWVIGGTVKVSESAQADWRIGGSVQLTAPVRLTEQAHRYILMGGADIYNDALTHTLLTFGTGGRTVEWGLLQDAAEFETADWMPIAVEDGNCGALVPMMERTEITCTAIFLNETPLPKRGDIAAWMTADGNPVQGVVLNRRVVYANGTAAAAQLNIAAYDGLL